METYFCAVVVLSFLQDHATAVSVIFDAFIVLVGFFMGWLVGHARNNAIQFDMMNALESAEEELKHLKWQLKNSTDHEAFLDHENSVLNKELDRRQNIINAYKIGHPKTGIYSDDPLACTGCVSGCFRCLHPQENGEPNATKP